jgi:Smg protein
MRGGFTNAHAARDRPPAAWAIVPRMFDVLVYLYENYWRPDACPSATLLSRKLTAAGFERDEIEEALHWLGGLPAAETEGAEATIESLPQQPTSTRVYTLEEREALGPDSIAFITFLESSGVLPASLREVVIERAVASGHAPIDVEDLKVMVLMVFWSLGEEPDALILDELFVDDQDRLLH